MGSCTERHRAEPHGLPGTDPVMPAVFCYLDTYRDVAVSEKLFDVETTLQIACIHGERERTTAMICKISCSDLPKMVA